MFGEIRIVDLDSTVSDDRWRLWMIDPMKEDNFEKYYPYHSFCDQDKPINRHIVDESPVPVFFLTARPESVRGKTQKWLKENGFKCQGLLMRSDSDTSSSVDFKKSIATELLQIFKIESAYDDRFDIIKMYDSLNIKGVLV